MIIEIKFRAKRLNEPKGEWIYGDLLHGLDDFCYIQNLSNPPSSGYRGAIDVDPKTVGQYITFW